jgi:hypothetical protein
MTEAAQREAKRNGIPIRYVNSSSSSALEQVLDF